MQKSTRAARRLIALVVLLLGVLGASPAPAQTADRLEQELRRTDQVIDDASLVVRDGDSVRARDILDIARRIQRDAWESFPATRLLISRNLTLEARATAGRALSLAREDDTVRERAQREMDRAEQTIGRARDRVDEYPSPEATRLLDQASALLTRSRGTFGEQHYLAAMRLALAAQRLAAQAASFGTTGDVRRLSRDLDRTDHLLERVQSLVDERGDAPSAKQLEQAHSMQDAAWAAFREGRSREAHARTREARGLANRVRVELGGVETPSAAPAALAETREILDRAADVVRSSGDEHARALLDRAAEHQSRAQASLDAGDVRRALAQTRVARQLAKRALQLVNDSRSD